MRLVYLWIESYRYIKQRGYLLNANYEVHYDAESKELEIKKAESLDSLLYGDKLSVTAIVGDNGAGKSTLLDAIRLVLFDERSRKKEIEGFLIWEGENQLSIFSFGEEPLKIISSISCEKQGYLPDDFDLIYYADFLDSKYYLEDFDDGEDTYTHIDSNDAIGEVQGGFQNRYRNQYNISTTYLLRKSSNRIMDFFHEDIKKQICYYGSLEKDKLPFSIPEHLSLELEFLGVDIFDKVLDAPLAAYEYMGMRHKGERNTDAQVIGLLKTMERVYEEKTIRNLTPLGVREILQWDIWVAFLYNLLAHRREGHKKDDDYTRIDGMLEDTLNEGVREEQFFRELDRLFQRTYRSNIEFEMYLRNYQKIIDLLEKSKVQDGQSNTILQVNATLPSHMMDILWEDDPLVFRDLHVRRDGSLDLEKMRSEFEDRYMKSEGWSGAWHMDTFLELFKCYARLSSEIDFLKFNWGLSTGESNFFNLMARLYDVMKQSGKEKILLLFDELDSSFHPQWQQKIMKAFTTFLRDKFPRTEFQVLLTTHSPVLLSDIPRENVVFLRKEQSQQSLHEQTFAANIASLYYDSFFMEQGSIGEVAQESMVNLLDSIAELEEEKLPQNGRREKRGARLAQRFLEKQNPTKKKISVKDSENTLRLIQKLINSIGEDIWRYKLNESFHYFLQNEGKNTKEKVWEQLKELERKEGRSAVEELIQMWQREEEV